MDDKPILSTDSQAVVSRRIATCEHISRGDTGIFVTVTDRTGSHHREVCIACAEEHNNNGNGPRRLMLLAGEAAYPVRWERES